MINFALSSDPKGLKNDTRFGIALSESCIFDTTINLQGFFGANAVVMFLY